MAKFIFVTGGVVSGLGKGLTVASLGKILKSRGLNVVAQKLDPYVNIDPGTMSPYQHGEVFVTDDGTEADLDLGHYERFIDQDLDQFSYLTSGKVYWNVLNKERNGEYLGNTVQVIPHITNEIKRFIYSLASNTNSDVIITEIGGTVGDIEIQPFIESIRQISMEVGPSNCLFIHLTLVPFISTSEEYKTKPTQHSVKELRSMGINPDIIVARCDRSISIDLKKKIALFCSVKPNCVIENVSLPSLYSVPLMLEKQGFSDIVLEKLNMVCDSARLENWKNMVLQLNSCVHNVCIAIVGKYIKFKDAYLSIVESLNHAGAALKTKVQIKWIDAELLTNSNVIEILKDCSGVLVPGGFDSRGVEGMIVAINYARENNVPFFGICLGMQIALIEFARNCLKISDATSEEFSKIGTHIIHLMPKQKVISSKGATMRLGAYICKVKNGSFLEKIYKSSEFSERHRHRFEFNSKFTDQFEKNGVVFSGVSPDGSLVEVIEIPSLKFFVGVQFHPEFKSRPNRPHPLFFEFVKSTL